MVTRNYNWGVELTKRGHEVTIIAAGYSHYRNQNPVIGENKIQRQRINNIDFIWLKTTPYDGGSALGRIKAMAQFQFGIEKLKSNLIAENFDVVVASSPHPFVIYSAHSIARQNNAKLIYDIRDLWPLSLKALGGMSKWHPFIIALQRAENFACHKANLVTATQQNAKAYLVDHGMAEEKFLHIGNGYLPSETQNPLTAKYKNKILELKEQGAFLIGYCGTLGTANAMHSAIESLALTKNKNSHLVLIGKGYLAHDLKALAKQRKVNNRVHFFDPVPHNEVADFLNRVDVAYISAVKTGLYKHGISPAKINDYMAAKKPVLYGMGDPNNPIELSGAGICCAPENHPQIAEAMDTLSQTPQSELQAMGQKGYDWLMQNQTLEKQMDKLLAHLKVITI